MPSAAELDQPKWSPSKMSDELEVDRDTTGNVLKKVDSERQSNLGEDLAVPDVEPFKLSRVLFRRRSRPKGAQLDAVATEASVFDDPLLSPYYQPTPNYEGIHRFDPKARWTYREEKTLVRKLDWRITLWAAIAFASFNIDSSNLYQANSDNFLPDLNLTTDDFNLGNSLFRAAFLIAEIPSQLIAKRIGPDRWVPVEMCAWAIITAAQFFLTGRSSFLACQVLLGITEGGFIPTLVLYLSYFYKKRELPLRLAYFWTSLSVCNILSSFLALGILKMEGVLNKAGWRWLFLIEGLGTLLIGLATFIMMPASPTQTKNVFWPNGWFTEREEVIMVNRILRDDPSKGDMHNRQGISLKRLLKEITDFDLYPLYAIGFMFCIPITPPGFYISLNLRSLGFSTAQTNLLFIPFTAMGLLCLLGITLFSEMVDNRAFVSMAQDLWALPCLVALYMLPPNPNPWIYYAVTTVLLAYPYTNAIQVAWCSRNAGAVSNRAINASLYNMFAQAGSIVSAQIYKANDAPRYRRGNRTLIIICLFNILILYPGTWLYYKWRNKSRDKIWNAMSPEEKANYLATTRDVGNRRLDFRFVY